MSVTIAATATAVNGLKLVEALNYDHQLCAVLIATRDDWAEILDSIQAVNPRKNLAAAVLKIREALGLEAAHAMDICQGRE